jgi:PPOX class probable F420-dependent enzyme
MGQLTMTKEEREAFLADVHVGVLAVNGDGAPSVTPIWYVYEPGGEVLISTAADSPKTALLRRAGRASVCVQTETAPYKYVVVEGPVTIDDAVDSAWRRALAQRYLGDELGDVYADSTMDAEANAVVVRVKPDRWRTIDYGKQFA